MKNAYLTLFFLALATFSFGQFNATYTATNINGPFDNGEVVEVDYSFFNFSGQFITANAELQFTQGSTVISTVDFAEIVVANNASPSGTYTFTFGSGCDLPAGDYTLNLIVNFGHISTGDKSVNVTYNGVGVCPGYTIPGSSWNGPDCTIPIFTNQNFTGGCCEDITIDIVASKYSKTKPCGLKVQFTVLGILPGSYTHVWDDGSTSPTRYLFCGKKTYSVTVFWTSADGTSCSETYSEQVQSPCYCAQEDPRIPRLAAEEEEGLSIKQEVEVYPNPSNGRMFLKIADGKNVHQIQVFNTLGQLEQDVRGTFTETQELTLDNTATGLRYLRLFFSDGHSKTVQILVQ